MYFSYIVLRKHTQRIAKKGNLKYKKDNENIIKYIGHDLLILTSKFLMRLYCVCVETT